MAAIPVGPEASADGAGADGAADVGAGVCCGCESSLLFPFAVLMATAAAAACAIFPPCTHDVIHTVMAMAKPIRKNGLTLRSLFNHFFDYTRTAMKDD